MNCGNCKQHIGILKLKQNSEGFYTHSNQVKLQTEVLKRIRLSVAETVKEKKRKLVRDRSQIV